jgi:hypothetical protein
MLWELDLILNYATNIGVVGKHLPDVSGSQHQNTKEDPTNLFHEKE